MEGRYINVILFICLDFLKEIFSCFKMMSFVKISVMLNEAEYSRLNVRPILGSQPRLGPDLQKYLTIYHKIILSLS